MTGLSGSRGLARVSENPTCRLQAAMVVARADERAVYAALNGGQPYAGEYGQRASALRRGYLFEQQLYAENAALLRAAVGPLYGHDVGRMLVRDLRAVGIGAPGEVSAQRLAATRRVFTALAASRRVPELILQPQLALPLGTGRARMFIGPDFLVLDPATPGGPMYVPGEIKSQISRDGQEDPADRNSARRQAAAQVLALRAESARVGLERRVAARALFLFAGPVGLRPAPVAPDRLDAEVYAVEQALGVVAAVQAAIAPVLRREPGADAAPGAGPLATLAPELPIHYQEGCLTGCLLSSLCRARLAGQAAILGDAVRALLGDSADLARWSALLDGADTPTAAEAELLPTLAAARDLLRLPTGDGAPVPVFTPERSTR